MQYMLLIYLDENALSDSEREKCYVESAGYARQLNASGHYLAASPLHPTSTATSLRIRDGKRLDEALGELEDAGRVRVRQDGRKRTVEINPALLEAKP